MSDITPITEKLDKIDANMELILKLQQDLTAQTEKVMELTLAMSEKDQMIADLKETVEYLKKMVFGRKSERSKYYDMPGQIDMYSLFNIDRPDGDDVIERQETEKDVSGYTRKEKKKRSTYDEVYANLPAEKVVIPVTDEDRVCPNCGEEMTHLGEKFVRTEIEVVPAKVKRKDIYRETVICENCKADDVPTIVEAKIREPLLQHSPATPSTVAYAMYMKYVNSVPLYRQEKEWIQMGVKIPRITLSKWIITCTTEYLVPIKERLKAHQMERLVVCADETPCQVLKEEGKTPQSKSYMWLYCTADDGLAPIALYDYQPSRHGWHAKEFLKDFKGKYVVCDGYQGYNELPATVKRCGCLAHVRRKWADAIPPDRRKRKPDGKAVPAEIGFDYCNRLFDLERKFKESGDAAERRKIRDEIEPAIWKEFFEWLDTVHASSKCRLGIAVNYTLNQKPVLMNYLEDDSIPISNNFAENAARPYAVGRKNFLFHNSTDGADTSATIYSIVESAKRNGLNVMDYLIEVLDTMRVCNEENKSDIIENLMPWSDQMQETCRADRKKNDDTKIQK